MAMLAFVFIGYLLIGFIDLMEKALLKDVPGA